MDVLDECSDPANEAAIITGQTGRVAVLTTGR
jgi:hypothetical protein